MESSRALAIFPVVLHFRDIPVGRGGGAEGIDATTGGEKKSGGRAKSCTVSRARRRRSGAVSHTCAGASQSDRGIVRRWSDSDRAGPAGRVASVDGAPRGSS